MADSWRTITLGEFVHLKRGHDLPEQDRRPGAVPILGSFGVTGFHDEAKVPGPGVTIGRSGASIGVAAYCREAYWPLNTVLYVTDFRGNDPRFAYYYFKGFDFARYNSGSAQPSLNRNFINPVQIRVPDRETQVAISAVLGALDEKIDLNSRMNATLEATASALFRSWFVDFDPVRGARAVFDDDVLRLFPRDLEGGLPRGWRRGTLDELQADAPNAITAGPFGSKLGRSDYVDVGVPVIRGGNLGGAPGEWFVERDFVFVSEEKAQRELKSSMAQRGDVLFTQRGTLGQVGMIPHDARHANYVISQSQMKMTCARHVPAAYVVLAFKQRETLAYIESNAVAAGVPHINLGFLRRFPMLIPTKEVLHAFRSLVEPLQQRMRHNVLENASLTELRDALLPRLLSGELRIRECEKAVGAVA